MFKIFITNTIYDSFVSTEEQKTASSRSNLYKILKQQTTMILTAEQTEKLKTHPEDVLKNPSSLYILDITSYDALAIQRKYGVLCLSGENLDISQLIDVNDAFISNKHTKLANGWDTVLNSVETLPSNALILADRYIFHSTNASDGDGFANIEAILTELLPHQFDVEKEYHVCIIFNKDDSAYKFSDVIKRLEEIKQNLNRDYPIKMEVLAIHKKSKLYDKLHNRVILSNYYMVEAAHKLAAFDVDTGTARQIIIPLTLFTESSLTGASSAPLVDIDQNIEAIKDFSDFVSKVSTYTDYLYAENGKRISPCNGIKNRLLKYNDNCSTKSNN